MTRAPEPTEADQVRWLTGRTWRYGHLNGNHPEADGSVRVWDDYTGGARSLPLEALQHRTRGPRGGRRWEWIVPRPDLVVTAVCAIRPAWNPPEGPAELFDQAVLFEVGP
jgi:hypothetical protein